MLVLSARIKGKCFIFILKYFYQCKTTSKPFTTMTDGDSGKKGGLWTYVTMKKDIRAKLDFNLFIYTTVQNFGVRFLRYLKKKYFISSCYYYYYYCCCFYIVIFIIIIIMIPKDTFI